MVFGFDIVSYVKVGPSMPTFHMGCCIFPTNKTFRARLAIEYARDMYPHQNSKFLCLVMQYTHMAILSRSDSVPPFAFANTQNNIFRYHGEREVHF